MKPWNKVKSFFKKEKKIKWPKSYEIELDEDEMILQDSTDFIHVVKKSDHSFVRHIGVEPDEPWPRK